MCVRQVAVKSVGETRLQSGRADFLKEAAVLHALSHDHIVRLYGVVLSPAALMLVTELAPLRSLLECLRDTQLRHSFPVTRLCEFAVQVCDGMAYLENRRLIHRDLAARNVLVFAKDKVRARTVIEEALVLSSLLSTGCVCILIVFA